MKRKSSRRLAYEQLKANPPSLPPLVSKGYNPNDPRFTAFHEAGHAVSAIVLGFPLEYVHIKENIMDDGTTSTGFTRTPPVGAEEVDGKGEGAAMPHMIQCFTGPFAEALVNDRMREYSPWSGDKEQARTCAAVAVCGLVETGKGYAEVPVERMQQHKARLDALVSAAAKAASKLVNENTSAIAAVAEALFERKELTGDEVVEIMRGLPQTGSVEADWLVPGGLERKTGGK
jgi:hypothetical protein